VVGGGPTGVTLSAKIADLLNNELADAYPNLIDKAQIYILEATDGLVQKAGRWFINRVTEALVHKDRVAITTDAQVKRVEVNGVAYNGDQFLRSECVIWTAGVKARECGFVNTDGDTINIDGRTKRVHVTPKLHLPDDKHVYVAGDQAWVERIDADQPYPMRAQFAVRQGKQAGRNILAVIRGQPQERFRWQDKGLVISVGHGQTFAEIFGLKLSGFPATIAYKSVYLMSTIGVRNKFRAMLEWFMNLFLPRDISEL
jgi:NADH dehydrogenase